MVLGRIWLFFLVFMIALACSQRNEHQDNSLSDGGDDSDLVSGNDTNGASSGESDEDGSKGTGAEGDVDSEIDSDSDGGGSNADSADDSVSSGDSDDETSDDESDAFDDSDDSESSDDLEGNSGSDSDSDTDSDIDTDTETDRDDESSDDTSIDDSDTRNLDTEMLAGTDTELEVAEEYESYVVNDAEDGSIGLVANGSALPLVVHGNDYPGVLRAVDDLQEDIERVTSASSTVSNTIPAAAERAVLIGTIGNSPLIDALVQSGKLDVSAVEGRWETFMLQVVETPTDDLEQALVIAGSDQRGTIFGIYDLSSEIGVSPWYWWDDVTPIRQDALYILPGLHTKGEPAVKYRGFFINDENPALSSWVANANFFNTDYVFKADFYAKVFEVMLRLKANYLWPAVWGRAFAEDDGQNHATAKRYGIVMGTSHEAPMMRGIEEWNRGVTKDSSGEPVSDPYGGNGKWQYSQNADALRTYWREGIERMVSEDFEGVVTIGMRGPGDVSLPPEEGIDIVEELIGVQRDIIGNVTGNDPSQVPQVWTLYKEVQDWWEQGLTVPDDVTVVWCDDNWGNMRKLPGRNDSGRSGGYGLYYHFDYVGGPRNYKWVDTNLVPNIWEQLHLAYNYGVDRLWVVNVGDLKNEELPLQFFLDYAWDPDAWPLERLSAWERRYAKQNFGAEHAEEIAALLHTYATLQSDRKPELLNRKVIVNADQDFSDPDAAVTYHEGASPFSLTNYRELERVTDDWLDLTEKAEQVGNTIPQNLQDAYYQLVLYQIKASALMYELRLAGFRNLLYRDQGRAATNDMATIAQDRFSQSQDMANYYNNQLAGGKWRGFQSQPYLAYGGPYDNSGWQQPETNGSADPDFIWPELVSLSVPNGAGMGIAIDGSDNVWPSETTAAALPTFSPFQTQPAQYIEVFNTGSGTLDFEISTVPDAPWLTISPNEGTLNNTTKEIRATVEIANWDDVPAGTTSVTITVSGGSSSVDIEAIVENPDFTPVSGHVEANGYVSVESDHYTRMVDSEAASWMRIPNIGRTGSGMTPSPVTMASQTPGGDSPRLEFDMHIFNPGAVTVWVYASPRNNVLNGDGLKYAVSFDDASPETVNITTALNGIPVNKSWERNVSDNINLTRTTHTIDGAGLHVLKVWAVDPAVVIQKIVVDTGALLESYLGPPESFYTPR